MQVRCESCGKSYDYVENDGLCPKCGCYNNISDRDALRVDAEQGCYIDMLRQKHEGDAGSLCDAHPESTFLAGQYAPDCMEDSHDPNHVHTGGANVARREAQQRLQPQYQRPEAKRGGLRGCLSAVLILWIVSLVISLLGSLLNNL